MLTREEILSQVGRILQSKLFAGSKRLCRFMRFAVDASLDGRAHELKEYLIGVEVFDRKASFDPRIDPIVRVEARRLRSRLRQYYEIHGKADPVLIQFPTGSYAPEFGPNSPDVAIASAPGAATRLAVLPFANLTGGDDDYFSDGLTEELIHALTRVNRLTVVAWPSAHEFKGQPLDLTRVAEQLKVQAVLEGSVRKHGGRLRIAAQLIDVKTGSYIWSESYNRGMEDIFTIQEDIARAIAGKLQVRLAVDSGRFIQSEPSCLDAYHSYLWGRYHWHKRSSGENIKEAIGHFEDAVAKDPDYAAAWAGLADARAIFRVWGAWAPGDRKSTAKAAALRALELDENSAEAHASLGFILTEFEYDLKKARYHFERSIHLNPGYPTAHHWYAYEYLAPMGRLTEALSEIQLAQDLDPLSLIIGVEAGSLLYFNRQYEDSANQYRKVLEWNHKFDRAKMGLARTYIQLGRFDEGIRMLEEISAGPDQVIVEALLGHAYAVSGQTARAHSVLDAVTKRSQTAHVPAFIFARVYLGLDDTDQAFYWLEKSFEARDPHLLHLKVAPVFDGIRGDPRYTAMLKKVGLNEGNLTVSNSR